MTKEQAIALLVGIAIKEVGVREDKANNTGVRIAHYQDATNLAIGPWPWCAAFVAWCVREWVCNPEVRDLLGFGSSFEAESWRCHSAGAYDWEKWAKKKGLPVLPETQLARAGDLVTFDFSHIGIVIEDQLNVKAKIITVEGNTNGKGERDSEKGDGVWRKERVPSLVKSYIRILA